MKLKRIISTPPEYYNRRRTCFVTKTEVDQNICAEQLENAFDAIISYSGATVYEICPLKVLSLMIFILLWTFLT